MALTIQERMELGVEAAETIKDKLFLAAIARMKKEAHEVIILNPPGSLTSQQACAKLQVLDGFLNELQSIYGDGAIAAHTAKQGNKS